MFCPNCGTDCKDANFCPECGTSLRGWNETENALPSDIDGTDTAAAELNIPTGKYSGTLGYIELRDTDVLIYKKILFKTVETTINYTDIAAVAYQKAKGLSSGFLSIRSKQERFTPLANGFTAPSDKTALTFETAENVPMFQAYQCLQAFAERNRIDCTPTEVPDEMVSSGIEPIAVTDGNGASACSIDMDAYFERFNPNKTAAIKAIVKETGMDVRQAKDLVDREFAQRQKALYTAQPDVAMRDLKRTLTPKKAERDERKAELDKQGVVYCPKCLSTSVTGDKKGFGIGKAVVGASLVGGLGLMAGNINAKKVRLTCMKCGYQWIAGKK